MHLSSLFGSNPFAGCALTGVRRPRRNLAAILLVLPLLLGLVAPNEAHAQSDNDEPSAADRVQMRNVKRSIAEFGNHKANGGVRVLVEIGDGLSPKGSARTINYTVGGTASRGVGKDYTIDGCASSTCSVKLPANRHTAVITIYVHDDGIDENDETIVFTLTDGNDYMLNNARKTTTVTIRDDDTRGLTFHRRWPDVKEGSSATYTVRLSSQPTAAVTVNIKSDNPDVTVSPTSLTFNPSGSNLWSRARTVTVTAAEDSDAVDDEATLTHTTSGGDYRGANALSIGRPVSVDDDDTSTTRPGPQLPRITVTGGAAVTEGRPAVFTVNADRAPTASLTVNVEVSEPDGQNFVAASQEGVRTVTIPAGAASATFTVPTVNDSTDEDDGAVQVSVNDGAGYEAGSGVAEVTVRDNDNPIPSAFFGSGLSSAAENAGTQNVAVNLTRPAPSGGLTLGYSVSGSATAGSGNDFTIRNSGTLSIAAGATTATIPVAINDDSTQESAETVILTLTGGTGYRLGSPRVHTLTITDNDGTGGQATLSLSGPAGANEGNSGSSDKFFTVSLSRAPSRFVSWQLCFSGTATIDASGSGTIPAGADYQAISGGTPIDLRGRSPVCTSRTFKTTDSSFANTDLGIRIKGDTESESDETVTLTLRIDDGPADVVLGTSVVTYTIRDDDAPSQPSASFAAGSSSAAENAGTHNVRVNLSSAAPSGGLTLGYSVSGSATAGSGNDFTIRNSGTLSIAAGARTANIPVAINDDSTQEGPETVILTLTGRTGYTLGTRTTHTLTITDNDTPQPGTPALQLSRNTLSVSEGGTGSYTVRLATEPTGRVIVNIASDNGDVTVSPSSLTFNPSGGNLWNSPQTVTVSAVQDADSANDSATLTHTASDGGYGGVAAASATVTVNDDDGTNPGPAPSADSNPGPEPEPGLEAGRGWLVRIGRTVAGQGLDSIARRLRAPRTPGMEGRLGGQAIAFNPWAAAGAGDRAPVSTGGASRPGSSANRAGTQGPADIARHLDGGQDGRFGAAETQTMTGRELLLGSSFSLTGGKNADGGTMAFWGRAATGTFDGEEDALGLDGEVTTGMLGADYARGKWLVGLALTHSTGEGGYRGIASGGDAVIAGKAKSSLTAALPYAALRVSEQLKLWGAAGYGTGEVTLTPEDGDPMSADTDWMMAAAGFRDELLAPPAEGSGPALAVTSDVMWANTTSEKTAGLAASDADVTRLRFGLEGGWRIAMEDDAYLTPTLELGARHDGGDAETGFGVELGGGIAWADPDIGLLVDVTGRTLIAHEDGDLKDRGLSASVAFDPDPASGRGPSLSLLQEFGGPARGGLDALFVDDPLEDRTGSEAESRWSAEAAYGFPVFGGRFTGSPHAGFGLATGRRDYSLGWRWTPAASAPELPFGLKAVRRESDTKAPEHTVGLEATVRW